MGCRTCIRRASRSGTPFPIVISGASGVDITIGNGVPDLLARLMPRKYRFSRAVDSALCERILAKVRAGNELAEAELEFAETFLSDSARKFVRLTSIQERALVLIEQHRQVPLLE